jgi:RNA polymerase sigma-70 factor (ECF subfamily)
MDTKATRGTVGDTNPAPLIDRSLLDAAITLYYDDIRGAARRRGLDAAGATEVVHDVYINLARQPQVLAGRHSLRAFLMRAAANLGLDRLKRQAFERKLFAELERAASTPVTVVDPAYNLDRARYVSAIKSAIEELPPQCRNVFIAHRIGGLSKEEIAEGLGIRRRMIDRHLRKALLHCMERIEKLG